MLVILINNHRQDFHNLRHRRLKLIHHHKCDDQTTHNIHHHKRQTAEIIHHILHRKPIAQTSNHIRQISQTIPIFRLTQTNRQFENPIIIIIITVHHDRMDQITIQWVTAIAFQISRSIHLHNPHPNSTQIQIRTTESQQAEAVADSIQRFLVKTASKTTQRQHRVVEEADLIHQFLDSGR